MSAPVLHVRGQVLVGPDDVRDELWVVDGRVTYDAPPPARDVRRSAAGCCPGWSTRTATSGSTPTAPSTRRPPRQQALRRPRRRHAAHPRRRLAGRHPLGRRPRGPAADHPGRPAHRPHPPLHPQLRPRGRARATSSRYVRQEARARRRLGQARRRLDRPRRRRPGPVLAARTCSTPRSPPPTRRAPGSPRTASARSRCTTSPPPGIDCIEHATGLEPDTIDAVRGAGHRHRPDPRQHRDLPAASPSAAGSKFPAYHRAHARPARAPLRDRRARRTRPASRSTSAPTPAASCRTGWSPRRLPSS